MICEKLSRNIDNQCASPARKWEQRVVLLPFNDILGYTLNTSSNKHQSEVDLLLSYSGGHHIAANGNGTSINASFSMLRDDNIPRYTHSVSFPVIGVGDLPMSSIRQIDASKYVAFVRFSDGIIKIFGLENGLKSTGYSYTPQSSSGGGIITLKSDFEEPYMPLVYSGDPSNFDNDFNNPIIDLTGDYSNDYSNDYARNFYL